MKFPTFFWYHWSWNRNSFSTFLFEPCVWSNIYILQWRFFSGFLFSTLSRLSPSWINLQIHDPAHVQIIPSLQTTIILYWTFFFLAGMPCSNFSMNSHFCHRIKKTLFFFVMLWDSEPDGNGCLCMIIQAFSFLLFHSLTDSSPRSLSYVWSHPLLGLAFDFNSVWI